MSLTDLLALAEKRRTRGCLLGRWAGAAVSWGQRRSLRDHLTRAHAAPRQGTADSAHARPQTHETSLSRTSLPHQAWRGLNLPATGSLTDRGQRVRF